MIQSQKLELYKDPGVFTYSSDNGFDLRTTKLDITGLTISGVDRHSDNKILLGSEPL